MKIEGANYKKRWQGFKDPPEEWATTISSDINGLV
jgi:hypothetical protein